MNTQTFPLSLSLLSLLPLSSSLPQYHPAYSPFYGLPSGGNPTFSYGPVYGSPFTVATHSHFSPGVGQHTALRGSHLSPPSPARLAPAQFTNSKVSPELARWAGGRHYGYGTGVILV